MRYTVDAGVLLLHVIHGVDRTRCDMENIKAEFKKYVYNSPNPDLKAFSIMKRVPYNLIDRPELALLRELALHKQVLYLQKKQVHLSGSDRRLNEPISSSGVSQHVYNAMAHASDHLKPNQFTYACLNSDGEFYPCKAIQFKIKRQDRRDKLKIWKEIYFWFASTVWLVAGGLVVAKLASLWL